MPAASLPYHEPGLEDILILSTFLLALNLVNSALDRTLYCGLVGQVFVGVAWGTPGAGWLSEPAEHAVVQLGYLGLIMIVFEGGSSSSLPTMRANLALASGVALTGVAAPMALSFVLEPLAGATALQAFAAGAALCSTSLGTTFTVLSTSGLASTRLGSILSTAAMMDDVVGLVMVQIVSSGLSSGGGGSGGSIAPVVVIRPVLVSVAFAVVVPLACRFVLRPLMTYVWKPRAKQSLLARRLAQAGQSAFLVQTAVLLGLVAAAGYAGASVLLAAYLAGIVASWWRDERAALLLAASSSPPPEQGVAAASVERDPTAAEGHANLSSTRHSPITCADEGNVDSTSSSSQTVAATLSETNNHRDMYSTYYGDSVERILKPFFFASIGFSIPITRMFSGPVVWRGIIYAILMVLGKTLCGAWLVRFPVSISSFFGGMYASASRTLRVVLQNITRPGRLIHQKQRGEGKESRVTENQEQSTGPMTSESQAGGPAASASPEQAKKSGQAGKPLSLYPSGIVSCAMVARGEIGFLISSVAESKGIFRSSSSSSASEEEGASEIFLIITWAIVVCTILGPLCVGLLVRRVKKLEGRSAPGQVEGNKKNVLGVWGVT
ncbi:Cation/H(+) antiporter 17 [Apiospora arundinis]|uniref:Cation/H(+) antiporter 17 n=1 Tax=Apiospora arundinis TaxID=335852 RepID=A0ABR2IEL1_9PEZI